ncbi:MAG: type II toxin-antitoxin system VapB family antitoxin [Chloroflexi bacterium]|nr:type II toxin-antitoxin system VapB family antitoxin [Chloroflexota bacterium]
MRTTINLDPKLIDEVVEVTGESIRGKAVNSAMEGFLKRAAIERLLAARGTYNIKDTSDDWEAVELEADEARAYKRGALDA